MLAHRRATTEVADGVWVLRHEWLDVNVVVVAGARGLLVVDTLGSASAARGLADDLRGLARGDVVAVVNTHDHYDHVLGNGTLRAQWPDLALHAHEEAAAAMPESVARAAGAAEDAGDPRAPEIADSALVVPDRLCSSVGVVDLGDRVVELVHPGRGHTAGDLVVRVPDADVVAAGDLVEESGPPAYGPDSFPLEWPTTLDLVVGLLGQQTVVVPGHGAPVDLAFVQDQRVDVTDVAEQIRVLAGSGVARADALARGEWPFEPDRLADAVRRGYDQLAPGELRLPLA